MDVGRDGDGDGGGIWSWIWIGMWICSGVEDWVDWGGVGDGRKGGDGDGCCRLPSLKDYCGLTR